MPVAESSSAAELARLAREADRRAEDEEARYRRLALTLLALELAAILRGIEKAQGDEGVLRVLTAARASYLSPQGLFRRRWVDRFGELMRESAARMAAETFGARALPAAVTRAIEQRAESLAAEATATTAQRLAGAQRAIRQEIADRRSGRAPVPTTFGPAVDQRLETLVPLIGRDAAEQVMRAVRAGREAGQSVKKVAQAVMRDVSATEVTRRRATVIARTETIGLQSLTEYELAIDRGMGEKRWLDQKDERVRESHRRCAREGWIPIRQRFSNGLQYPGQRPAPAAEVILCRCALAFRRA